MKPYYTQLREQTDGTFSIVGGDTPESMVEVGTARNYRAAQQYRGWWVGAMGVGAGHVNLGLQPLVAMQGHVLGH